MSRAPCTARRAPYKQEVKITMSSTDLLMKLFDRYERQARLYPAFLASAPLLAIGIGVYGVAFEPKAGLVALLATSGIVYLLATISRELGKRMENELFASWGGKPTTQILRHRDETIDGVTKARYHSFLAKKIRTPFPTPEGEFADPAAADAVYASGARWLLDQTRDTASFPLLFKELISYGFRRNCLGLKPIAIAVSVLSLIWLLFAHDVISSTGFDMNLLATLPMQARVVGLVNLALLFVWIFIISRRTVRTAAFMYADLLIRSCDTLK